MEQRTGIALLLLAGTASQVFAGTSAFDSQFGDSGRKLGTGFAVASQDVGRTVIPLSDGKIIVAGTTSTAVGKGDLLVTRLLADGSIDTSFGNQGSVALDGAGGDDFGYHAVKQADGKILVAGDCETDKTVSCIFRLNADGTADTGFGQQGKFLYTFADGDGTSRITKLALQSDGKIIAVGARELSNGGVSSDPFAMRLTTTGTLDTGFAASGLHVPVSAARDWAEAVAIDGNDRIVLAIYNTDLVAERLTSSGALDTAFNGTGRAIFDGGNTDLAHTVAIDSSNRVLLGGRVRVCGWSGNPCSGIGSYNAAVVRFTEAGALDTGFAVSGLASFDNLGTEYTTEILPTTDAGIFFGGTGYAYGTGDYFTFVARLDTNGTPLGYGDNTSTAYGAIAVNGSANSAHFAQIGGRKIIFLRGLTRLASGDIAYTGTAYNDGESSQLTITKLDAGGTPVTSFADGGSRLFSAKQDGARAWLKNIAQDANHQILIGETGAGNLIVTRIDNAGTFDTSFGNDGYVLVDGSSDTAELFDASVSSNGSIALAFAANPVNSDPEIGIRKLTSAGQPLTAFGGDGEVTAVVAADYSLGTGTTDGLKHVRITLLANGSTVVAASGTKADVSGVFLFRFDSNGVSESIINTPALGNFELHGLTADSSSRLYLAGKQVGQGKVFRLTAGGAIDTSFAASGEMSIAGDASSVEVKRLTLLGGNLYVTGSSDLAGETIGFVTKSTQNGTLDPTFGTGGTQRYLLGLDQSVVTDIQLRSDGKLHLAGSRFQTELDTDGVAVFMRTLANGSLDSDFGISGVVTKDNTEVSKGNSASLFSPASALIAGQCAKQACLLRATTDNGTATTSATSIAFGNLTIGTTSSAQTITLTNTGAGPLAISSVAVSGEFTAVSGCPTDTLASAASCAITVRFAPTSAGGKNGQLTIGTENGNTIIALSGIGQLPASTQLSVTTLAFASTTVNTNGNTLTVTVSNGGDETLTVSGIGITGDFAQTTTCGNSIAGRGSCTVSVQFQPKSAGSLTGVLTVTTSTGSQTVTLSGTGVAATPAPPPPPAEGGGGGGGGSSSLFGLLLMLPFLRLRQRR